ncbi:hypothetical protein BH10PSE19_BH10PSE19_17870 [soil metagenome]
MRVSKTSASYSCWANALKRMRYHPVKVLCALDQPTLKKSRKFIRDWYIYVLVQPTLIHMQATIDGDNRTGNITTGFCC